MNEIATSPKPKCYVCGNDGAPLYSGLSDRLFGATGKWNLKKCVDPSCGLVWLDPMPLEAELPKAYENYYTHADRPARKISWLRRFLRQAGEGYLARRYHYRDARRGRYESVGWLMYLHPGARANLDFSVFYLPWKPSGKLLEIGFGNAEMLVSMRARGWDVEGVDFDAVSVENAEAKGLSVHLGSLEQQRLPSGRYDAIVMSHVVEHVLDPNMLLKECNRLLRKGGVLISITPNTDGFGHRFYKRSWLSLDPPRHVHLFNEQTMRTLAEKSGFHDFKLFTTIRDANGLFVASTRIRKGFVTYEKVYGATRMEYYRARLMQLAEWALLKIFPHLGEEMVLIACKPSS